MKRTKLQAGLLLGFAVAFGGISCAPPPRPAVMADAEHARTTPAATEAKELAPASFAHAEKLRKLAEEAYEAKDFTGAQLLSERAIAAYQHAHVMARLARAARLSEEASVSLSESKAKLVTTEEELARVLAEADALEMRIQVARDALPITPSSPTNNYKRELARLASARSLLLDARLLCTATRLLDSNALGLAEAEGLVNELADKLAAEKPHPAPIDEASRARALCLAALTKARRAAETTSSMGRADALLATLSAMRSLEPRRDDRGIFVSLRNVFQGKGIAKEAGERIRELGKLAAAHPSFPLQVVVHSATSARSASAIAKQRAQGADVKKALAEAGAAAEKIHVELAGTAKPLVDPSSARDRHRNERIEIVFVNPGG